MPEVIEGIALESPGSMIFHPLGTTEEQGFWLVNLFGERTFIEGTIQSVDFMDGHFVILGKRKPT